MGDVADLAHGSPDRGSRIGAHPYVNSKRYCCQLRYLQHHVPRNLTPSPLKPIQGSHPYMNLARPSPSFSKAPQFPTALARPRNTFRRRFNPRARNTRRRCHLPGPQEPRSSSESRQVPLPQHIPHPRRPSHATDRPTDVPTHRPPTSRGPGHSHPGPKALATSPPTEATFASPIQSPTPPTPPTDTTNIPWLKTLPDRGTPGPWTRKWGFPKPYSDAHSEAAVPRAA